MVETLQRLPGLNHMSPHQSTPGTPRRHFYTEDERDRKDSQASSHPSHFAAPTPHQPSSEDSSSQFRPVNPSFISQPSNHTPLPSAVTSPEHRPRALHVSTILNPSPESPSNRSPHGYRPYDIPRRRSLAQTGSPPSAQRGHMNPAEQGPNISHPSSPSISYGPASDPADRYSNGPYPHPLNSAPTARRSAGTPVRSRSLRGSSSSIVTKTEPHQPPPITAIRTEIRSEPMISRTLEPPQPTLHGPPPTLPPPPAPPTPIQPSFSLPPVTSSLAYTSGPTFPGATYTPINKPSTGSLISTTPTVQGLQADFLRKPLVGAPPMSQGLSTVHGEQGGVAAIGGPAGHFAPAYPMMSLGNMRIPVDTTAASKGADEKRARNAGASARFRARRREREKEMAEKIAHLENAVKRLEEERDGWKMAAEQLQERLQQQQQQQQPRQEGQQQNIPNIFARSEAPASGYVPALSYAPTPSNYPGPERIESGSSFSHRSNGQPYTPTSEHLPSHSVSAPPPQHPPQPLRGKF